MKTAARRAGVKFVKKYRVRLGSAYEADPDDLVIPPPGHFLHDPDGSEGHDEVRVAAIDKTGKYVGAIPIWSDPDSGKLLVIDGRGNVLDCREVNRRRRARGDEPIGITVSRHPGTQEEAEDHVAMRNFLRKRPGAAHTAREIMRYHRMGRSWERIAEILGLHVDEKGLRRMVPLAYCQPEVIAAVEERRIPASFARRFGGRAMNGSSALGREEQIALLESVLAERQEKKAARKARPTREGDGNAASASAEVESRRTSGESERDQREAVATAFSQGARRLDKTEQVVARACASLLRYLNGNPRALDAWPNLKGIVEDALRGGGEPSAVAL